MFNVISDSHLKYRATLDATTHEREKGWSTENTIYPYLHNNSIAKGCMTIYLSDLCTAITEVEIFDFIIYGLLEDC